MEGRLVVQKGQNVGQVHLLDKQVIAIGRAPDNDIVVADDHVSRRHAEVRWDGQQYVLRDLGSKNGTFLNGRRLSEAQVLQPGDTIALPGLTLIFRLAQETLTVPEEVPAGELVVNADTAEVWVRGARVDVTAKEYQALLLLYRKGGALCSKSELAQHVWPEYQGEVSDYNIEQLISRLRRKLEEEPEHPHLLITVRGLGYRLMVS